MHTLPQEMRIYEDGVLLAAHPVVEGRHQRRVAPGHRKAATRGAATHGPEPDRGAIVARTGDRVGQRSLEFYDAVASRLAQ